MIEIESSLTVSGDPGSTALTTVDQVKSELQISLTDDDAWIGRQIDVASSWIMGPYGLKVPVADDDTRTCGRETLVQTYRLSNRYRYARIEPELSLARWRGKPLIASVEEDGAALQACDYALTKGGVLYRMDGDRPIVWCAQKVVVTYSSGWALPGDDGRDLPAEIEQACIEVVKMAYFGRQHDPMVKSESSPGVFSFVYGLPGDGPLPPGVVAMLQSWRY
jgi:hypothetical protein